MNKLDMNDSNFADKFREAIGAVPGEEIQIVTPQFGRTDGRAVTYIPKTPEEYAALPSLSDVALVAMGLQRWGDERGRMIWVFPAEWYSSIPAGTRVVDIFGDEEEFEPGVTDDDCRFGALSFGIWKEQK